MTVHPGLFVVGTDTGVGKDAGGRRDRAGPDRARPARRRFEAGGDRSDSPRGGPGVREDGEALIRAVGGGIPLNVWCRSSSRNRWPPRSAARALGTPLAASKCSKVCEAPLGWWADRGRRS